MGAVVALDLDIGLLRKIAVIAAGLFLPLVAVIGIAAAIAIPSFMKMDARSKEAAAKGGLGSLRSGLAIYYGDQEGAYPSDLNALVPKYLPQIPLLRLPNRPGASDVEYYDDDVCAGAKGEELDASKLRDSGKWGYVRPRPGAKPGAPAKGCVGMVFIDSTQTDSKQKIWYSY